MSTESAEIPVAEGPTVPGSQIPPPKGARKSAAKKSAPKKSAEPKAPRKSAPKKADPAAETAARPARAKAGSPIAMAKAPALLCRQIGDPTRAAILLVLLDGPLNVGEICAAVGGVSQPAISHHLALLRHGRIISPTRDGKNNIYDLEEDGRRLAGLLKTLATPAA